MSTVPADATVIWTDPPRLFHDGNLIDLTEEQRAEVGNPPRAHDGSVDDILSTLGELIEVAEEVGLKLDQNPGSEKFQAHMEAISSSIQDMVALVPGSALVLRAFGVDVED